jgi:ribonuclease BN (tRNA processing enzyme)
MSISHSFFNFLVWVCELHVAFNLIFSHGHMDHISSVCHHAAKRSLYSMKPATYYVPKHLVEPLKIIAQQFSKMHWEDSPVTTPVLENLDVRPFSPGESVKVWLLVVSKKLPGI